MKYPQLLSPTWNALKLFENIRPEAIQLTGPQKQEFQDFLWKDLCAEFDSLNLYRAIQARRETYSSDFLEFIEMWFRDETNHAQGFARIYELIYGQSTDASVRKLEARPADFSQLEEFLVDEFKLCLLLAYDELATTHTYRKDLAFYRDFGPPQFEEWIRRLIADEARHFSGAMKVIRTLHGHRAPEVSTVIQRILHLDTHATSYSATFVLDHSPDCVHFSLNAQELSEKCAAVIIHKLGA